jgi:Protein of unknown function (DUF3108)
LRVLSLRSIEELEAMLVDTARTLIRILAVAVLMLGMAVPLRAAQEMPLELRYGLYWGGLRLATLDLHHELAPGGYQAGLSIETVGLIEKFAKYRAEVNAVGERRWFGDLIPVTFSSKYKTRKKSRSAVIEFDPLTGDVVDLRIEKRGRPDGTDVPKELQHDVIDPLTAFLSLRDELARARIDGRGAFEAAVFDGRRRYDVEAQVTGRERVRISGRSWPAIRVELDILPIIGFDDDDLEEVGADENDPLRLEVMFSDDERLLPLQASTLDTTIAGTIRLLEDRLAAR